MNLVCDMSVLGSTISSSIGKPKKCSLAIHSRGWVWDAKDELERLKVREQVKREMALIDMEYVKNELKRVSGV